VLNAPVPKLTMSDQINGLEDLVDTGALHMLVYTTNRYHENA